MKGYPKFLNSKEDYEYVRVNFPKTEWEADFRALLETQYDWFSVGVLSDLAAGIEDDTHKVVVSESTTNETDKIYTQYEYRYNPDCPMARLGYTEDEVKAILGEE